MYATRALVDIKYPGQPGIIATSGIQNPLGLGGLGGENKQIHESYTTGNQSQIKNSAGAGRERGGGRDGSIAYPSNTVFRGSGTQGMLGDGGGGGARWRLAIHQ